MVTYGYHKSYQYDHRITPVFDENLSEPIKIARVLCIFFMFYTHINVNEMAPLIKGLRVFDYFQIIFTSTLGRSSVALLSVISGYLTVFSLTKTDYGQFIIKRCRSLLIPLGLWCAVFILFVICADWIKEGYLEDTLKGGFSLLSLPDLLFGITQSPANLPLHFLRDIFICSLLAPVMIEAYNRSKVLFIFMSALYFILGCISMIFISPTIFLFYVIGIVFAYEGVPKIGRKNIIGATFVLLFAGLVTVNLELGILIQNAVENEPKVMASLFIIRFPCAIVFWSLALYLSSTKFSGFIKRFENHIFFIFCGHIIVMTIICYLWDQFFGGYYSPAYPIFYLTVPLIIFFILSQAAKVMNAAYPRVFQLLNGGRKIM